MFKLLRIAILLLILATVAQEAWLARSRAASWQDPLRVAIYPINGDGSPATTGYLNGLRPNAFAAIDEFFAEEARRHGLAIARPVAATLAPVVNELPPQPPRGGSAFDNILWSLKMRWWAWRHDAVPGMKPQVRLFVLYFDPARNDSLPHSVGVQRGMIGLINAFATQGMAGSNAVIITHELLHTLGATDKYEAYSNLPSFPDGYAEPDRTPRYPQVFAEIMGGRIPVTESRADIPESIDQVLIGPGTATEIGWRKP
ncbi:MAG: hypothetical protein HZA64_05855 [Rhodocyclales bacterium]|jgi:hypothetical protein|nr:hypothetical protein [Rhodocyclales bacterium]